MMRGVQEDPKLPTCFQRHVHDGSFAQNGEVAEEKVFFSLLSELSLRDTHLITIVSKPSPPGILASDIHSCEWSGTR